MTDISDKQSARRSCNCDRREKGNVAVFDPFTGTGALPDVIIADPPCQASAYALDD